jgi:hypothetical protein
MEGRREVVEIEGDTVRLTRFRRALEQARPDRERLDERDFPVMAEAPEIGDLGRAIERGTCVDGRSLRSETLGSTAERA